MKNAPGEIAAASGKAWISDAQWIPIIENYNQSNHLDGFMMITCEDGLNSCIYSCFCVVYIIIMVHSEKILMNNFLFPILEMSLLQTQKVYIYRVSD